MKKIILFFVCFLFTSFYCYAQVGNAYYQKKIKNYDSESGDNFFDNAVENLENREYVLKFNTHNATFERVKSLDTKSNPVENTMADALSKFIGKSYFDSKKELILHQKEFAGTLFLIEKDKTIWQLKKDTLKIDNINCYKAVTTKEIINTEGTHKIEVTAWYAPTINIPYGPNYYGNLPGLIIQLEENGVITVLKKIDFTENVEKNEYAPPVKGKKVNDTQFSKITTNLFEKRKN